jgi:hypothetical protein
MAAILKLTRGASTLDLNDITNFALDVGWSPAVGRRRQTLMAGYGPFADVLESIPLKVRGATANAALVNLQTLYEYLDYSQRWYDGERIDPTLLHYQPDGSTLTNPPQVALIGQGELPIAIDPIFNQSIQAFEIPVAISPLRRGAFLGDEETGTSSEVDIGEVASVTGLNDLVLPGPVDLALRFPNITSFLSTGVPSNGFLAYAGEDGLVIASPPASGTYVASESNNALDSRVFEVAASAAHLNPVSFEDVQNISSMSTGARRFAIYATVRAPATGPTWELTARLTNGNQPPYFSTRTLTYTGTGYPEPILLGVVSTSMEINSVDLQVQSSSSSSDEFALNYFVVVALDRAGGVVEIKQDAARAVWSTVSGPRIYIEHKQIERPFPTCTLQSQPSGGYDLSANYTGNLSIHIPGDEINATYIATGGADATSWRMNHSTSGSATQQQLTIARRPAYLTPR